jgi:alpha-amylase
MKRKILVLLLAVCLLASVIFTGAVPAAAETEEYETYAQETVQGAVILHCFNWSYNSIKDALPEIAAAGYTAVQTSPVQTPKDYNASWTDSSGQWWKLYQPLGISVADGGTWLGTKAELTELCAEAEKYDIKVIVDVVVNHLANDTDGGTFAHLNENVDPALRHEEYFHSDPEYVNDDSRYCMTQRHLGMPDLNTGNADIQSYVLDFLCDCVDCGVDGFRFDAAKHIELPTDGDCASDFWPTVIGGVSEYADHELFFYGEILGGAGTDISNYTEYIAVTDNYTGDKALDKAYWCAAAELADSTYHKYAEPGKSVLWVESHDTYMGNSGTACFSNTSEVSDEVLAKAWAIVGGRAYSTALYLARPSDTMGEASTDTAWRSKTVAEINQFKNHFDGTNEYLSSSGNTAYNERGTRGVVISKLDGPGEVSLPAHRMEDGTYTDQITGNVFTVSNGTISGTVGDSCVAVVYDPDQPAAEYITASPIYLEPCSNWFNDGARFAMYLFNSGTNASCWVDMTDPDGDGVYSAALPEGDWSFVIFCRMNGAASENNWNNKWNQTADLFPPEGTNCYSVAEGTWDNGGGTWSWFGPQQTLAGDTDCDGTLAATDALLVMRYSMGIALVSEQGIVNGDMDGSGTLTATDAILIMRAVLAM